MNESKDIKDIEELYQTMNESVKVDAKEDGLGDDDNAKKIGNPKDPAPGHSEPVKPEDGEENALYMKKISERLKESHKKSEKSGGKPISNFVPMSEDNKNIFDKLYSTIMEGEDPFEDLGGMDAELDDEGGLEPGDELGGDEVTLSLPRDLAERLLDALSGELGDVAGDEIEDIDDGEDLGLEDEFLGDAVVSKPEPTDAGGAGPAMAGNKNNKPGGSGYNAKGGTAEKGNIKEDPTPKDLGGHSDRDHPDAGNTASGSNKVKTKSGVGPAF